MSHDSTDQSHFLEELTELNFGGVVAIRPGITRFGRYPKSCDFLLSFSYVGSQAVRILRLGRDTWVEEIGTGVGISVDGFAVDRRMRLSNGSQIKVGPYRFRYVSEESSYSLRLTNAVDVGNLHYV